VPNALIHEKSPYLLQHAHNPVDWMPWGGEAFRRARTGDKPIFLSIGYSTCHWCHVMEHESFENDVVAAVMNAEFINIKVDREERPDVDHIYMTFVQATTGHGGWPMSVWLTPDLQPFAGGTYFPPGDRQGRPGFTTVLKRIAELWRTERERLVNQGREVVDALRRQASTVGEGTNLPDAAAASRTLGHFQRSFDAAQGGFGGAPKFPRPVILDFLFCHAADKGLHHEEAVSATEMALVTLRKMASGGMIDHVGGGFHRYSVDDRWHVPHFEKMLYDQAQLAVSYLQAFQITEDPFFSGVAREIFDYAGRDLASPEGAFYSAEDADSLPAPGAKEKTEGAFYVWSDEELSRVLDSGEKDGFCRTFACQPGGNVDPASDPHGELSGLNVLWGSAPEGDPVWISVRGKLRAARDLRPRPHLDDKILTAWNGLMISALSRGAVVLDEPAWAGSAEKAARFILKELWNPETGVLLRGYREGPSPVRGFLADYAFLIRGLLDIYEAGGDTEWLARAVELQDWQDRIFGDPGRAYFSTRADDAALILRMKEDYDGAEPSGNSVSVWNLLRLHQWTRRGEYHRRAVGVLGEYAPALQGQGPALPLMLAAVAAAKEPWRQVVFAGDFSKGDGPALKRLAQAKFSPHQIMIHHPGGPVHRVLAGIEELAAMKPIDGQPAVYVCREFSCGSPVTTVEGWKKAL